MDIYLNFKNESREAIAFYEKVFETEASGITTYGEMPGIEQMNLPEEAKNLITNARLNIYDTLVMFADTPEGIGPELVVGNNVSLVIQTRNECLSSKKKKARLACYSVIIKLALTARHELWISLQMQVL